MALGNTPRQEIVISVEANKSYAFGVQFYNYDKSPVDLTDATVRMVIAEQVYMGGIELMTKEALPVGVGSGLVQFQFQAADLAIGEGSYPYDITLIPVTGYSTPVVKGVLEVGMNTDLDTSNVYGELITGSEITVYLGDSDVIEITIEKVDGLFTVVDQMIRDFRDEMQAQVAFAEQWAHTSHTSSAEVVVLTHQLQTWLNQVGFPFWKGTQAEYDAIPAPVDTVLYLITF